MYYAALKGRVQGLNKANETHENSDDMSPAPSTALVVDTEDLVPGFGAQNSCRVSYASQYISDISVA